MLSSQTSSQLQARVQRRTLANGIVAIAVHNPSVDIMAARLFFRAGSRCETKPGIGHLLAAVMTKGTAQLSSMEIAERVESVGASLGAESSTDYFLVSLKTVSADFADILMLAGELVREPSFPDAEIELERRLTLQSIRSQKEQPFAVAFSVLRDAMYGTHPYAYSTLGTEESVTQITRDDLVRYQQDYLRPDNLVVSLTGCIDPDRAFTLLESALGDWQAPPQSIPRPQISDPILKPRSIGIPQETQQAIIMLGYLTPSVLSRSGAPFNTPPDSFSGSPSAMPSALGSDIPEARSSALSTPTWSNPHVSAEYAALKLLNSYLGNGLSSRLFVELREKRGLAYDVSSFYPTRMDMAQFVAYIGTAPHNSRVAIDGLQAEINRLRDVQLDEAELAAAKSKLIGQYALGKQTNAQIAQLLGWYETIGVGLEFDPAFPAAIDAVTAELAQTVAQTYFTQPYIVVVGTEAAITSALYDPIEESSPSEHP